MKKLKKKECDTIPKPSLKMIEEHKASSDKQRYEKAEKCRLDALNYVKSELAQQTNDKLGKTMNPYRSEKIIFLRRIEKILKVES